MKKIWLIIGIILLFSLIIVNTGQISAIASTEHEYSHNSGLWAGVGGGGLDQPFTAQSTYQLNSISLDMYRDANCTEQFTIGIYNADGNGYPVGDALSYWIGDAVIVNVTEANHAIMRFNFIGGAGFQPVNIVQGNNYAIWIKFTGYAGGSMYIGYSISSSDLYGARELCFYIDHWTQQSSTTPVACFSNYGIDNPTASLINLPVSYLRNTDEWQLSAKITSLGTSSTGVVWFEYGTTSDMGYLTQATSSDGHGTMRFIIPKNQYTNGDTIYAQALLVLQVPLLPITTVQYNFSTSNPNVISASLTTIKARETGEGTIYAGGVINDFGLDSTVKADIVYGLSSGSYPFETPIYATLKNTGQISSYTVDFPKLESGVTIYYEAHIYGTLGGDAYGQEESFNTSDYGVNTNAIVQTSLVKEYSYTTATLPMEFLALGTTATSLDLSMWYSTSNAPDATYIETEVLAAQTDVGHYDFAITGLQPDTNYYYYAAGHSTTGGVTTDVHGIIDTFRTKATGSGGGLVDKGNNWLLTHGLNKNFWWVIVFIVMCLPWLAAPIREMPVVGVIIDVVALGAGITMLFDPWVTVVLAIIAAVIVGGLFIKKVVHQE